MCVCVCVCVIICTYQLNSSICTDSGHYYNLIFVILVWFLCLMVYQPS